MFRQQHSEDRFVEAFDRIAIALEKIASVRPPETMIQTKSFDDIRIALREGRKIAAIKLFRELTGAGLKDAKDQVDALEVRDHLMHLGEDKI